jgi:hypothetical protein
MGAAQASAQDAPQTAESTEPIEPMTAGRVVLESGLGLVGMGIAAALGVVAGLPFVEEDCEDGPCNLGAFVVGSFVGGTASLALTPLGVYLGGEAMGGEGGYGWTLLGALAGSGSGLVLFATALAVEDSGAVAIGGVVTGLAAQIAGAIVAYELSSADNRRKNAPTLALHGAPIDHGIVVGLRGRL